MRTVSRTTRRSVSRPSTRRRIYAKVATQPRKKKAIKRRVKRKVAAPILATRLKTLMGNLNFFITRRRKQYGKSDPIARSLSNIQSTIKRELKKYNVVNPNFVRSLKKINPSLRGKGPLALRQAAPRLAKFLREYVRKGCKTFLNRLDKILSPMQRELKKLEAKMTREIRNARSKNVRLKVDPSLKRRISALNTKITRFKKTWGKRFNMIATHGTRELKSAVKNIKKQLDEAQKAARRNLTILNRYAKAQKRKAGQKVKPLFTASQAKAFESKWNTIKAQCEKTRSECERFAEQLKSIKLF